MAHEPFRGGKDGFSALPSMSMMGLMYKPDLTYINSSDAAYKNAMARAKVLQSGNELHRHTYRGFSSRGMVGGDVYRGLSSGEATHVLKQFNTQQVDTDGMYEELPGDLSVAEMLMQQGSNNDPQSTTSPTLPTLPSSTLINKAAELFANSLSTHNNLLRNVPNSKLISGVEEILKSNPSDRKEVDEQIIYLLQDIAPDVLFVQTDDINDLISGVVQNNVVTALGTLMTNAILGAFDFLKPRSSVPQIANMPQRNAAVVSSPAIAEPRTPALSQAAVVPRTEGPVGGPRLGSPVFESPVPTAPVGGPRASPDNLYVSPVQQPQLVASPDRPPPALALFDQLPNIDKDFLLKENEYTLDEIAADPRWLEAFDLRLRYLREKADNPTMVASTALQRDMLSYLAASSNRALAFMKAFTRRTKDGFPMARGTNTYEGFGRRSGGMTPGYSFFTDRPPVWGRRWRHYKPTYGQMTVAEQNKLFGKIYGSEREALRENENYRVRRREQDRKFRVQAYRNDPNMRRWRTGRGKKVRKTKKVRRSVKQSATPKRPSVRIEHLPMYEERTYYEDLPGDRPAIEYLADSVRAHIQRKGGKLRRKVSRKYGGFVAPPVAPPVADPVIQGAMTLPLSQRLAAQRAKLLQQATPVATGGKRRRRYKGGARLIGGKLWIPNKSDPLYTM